jgi:ATP-dependent protease ClpP protease subunit
VALRAPKSMARREEERDEIATVIRHAELFHETGLSLPSRTIYMGSERVDEDGSETGTDAKMAERFIKNLHILEQVGDGEVRILMNNIGGCEYAGAAMFDAIYESQCHVKIIVRGHAFSMGSIILQAADERIMGRSAVQMIHYGTWGSEHESRSNKNHSREGERWERWMEAIYLDRILEKKRRFKMADLEKLLLVDTYFTAEESIDHGLADRIG